ncbi:hypothetical protein DMR_01380 [Solidesulfovibrio magneticus RS-1]|uniref:Uncharacterized protein n=1 Tax=Solidesulfovibrio magneticus (strain ATCC 700980 / DSM 13731 / RS-1) TaxID=573370 RepID=C4XTW4_SOLM1|nr:hypothetical protein DMR_01380 [Solidesulfovibrio magneticus RS-1]
MDISSVPPKINERQVMKVPRAANHFLHERALTRGLTRKQPERVAGDRFLPAPVGFPGPAPPSPPVRRPGHPLESRGRPPSWAVPLGLGDWSPRAWFRSRVAPLGPKPDFPGSAFYLARLVSWANPVLPSTASNTVRAIFRLSKANPFGTK